MTGLTDPLRELLTSAETMMHDPESPISEPGEAFRYALLKHIEEGLGLPVVVKYGDADSLRDRDGIGGDEVWEATPDGDYTLLRIEQEDPLTHGDRSVLDRTMLAAGAWHVGSAGVRGQPGWEHEHYVLPNDHPALQMLDNHE